MQTSSSTNCDQRKRDLAAIHIDAKRAGLIRTGDDSAYRDMLWCQARVRSAGDLDAGGRQRVRDHLRQLLGKGPLRRKKAGKRSLANDPQSRKIRSLWLQLHNIGQVKDPSELALCKFVHKVSRVDALEWLSTRQASQVIERLKKWLERAAGTGDLQ